MKARLISFEKYQNNGPARDNFNSSMKRLFGTVVTISQSPKHSDYLRIEGINYNWHKDWFVPIKRISLKSIK